MTEHTPPYHAPPADRQSQRQARPEKRHGLHHKPELTAAHLPRYSQYMMITMQMQSWAYVNCESVLSRRLLGLVA